MNSAPQSTVFESARQSLNELPWPSLRLASTIGLLSVAGMLNFAPILPLVRDEFGISNTWAAALTSGTLLTHTLLQMPAGHLVDSLGVRRSVMIGLTLIGIATLSAAISPSLAVILLTRLAVGVGTAIAFVSGLTVTNRIVGPEKRILAQSIFGVGASLGTMFVLLFSQRLAVFGGWRGALVIEGLFILVVGWIVALRLNGRSVHAANSMLPWSCVLHEWPLYLLGLAHVITYGLFTAVTTWIVSFLFESHDIGLEWAGPMSALLTLAAIVGRLTGGLFSGGRERGIIIWSCALTAVSVALLPLVPNLGLSLTALVVFGWAVSVPFGAIFAYISLVWGRTATGRELSTINFIANLGALAFPLLVGYLLDTTESFPLAFVTLAVIGLAGTAALVAWLPHTKNGD